MSRPFVSVVIPTYNRAGCVGDAIESVLAQTYADREVIVVDDGSTDDTTSVLARFGTAIRAIRQPNGGVSVARNTGIAAARGEWVAFLDSDDTWTPDKLSRQVAELSAHPEAVGHAVNVLIDGRTHEDSPVSLFSLRGCEDEYRQHPLRNRPLLEVLDCRFFMQATILRRSVIADAGLFRPGMTIHEDVDFLSRIALRGAFLTSVAPGVLLRRVAGGAEGLSNQHQKAAVRSYGQLCGLYDRLLERPDLAPRERLDLRRRVSGARFALSEALVRAGDRGEASRARWRSVRDFPSLRTSFRAVLGFVGIWTSWSAWTARRRGSRGFRRSDLEAGG